MHDFEKLGVFYLGKTRSPDGSSGDLLLYDSRDLTTHAVCVGMTGSGKTGLCLSLLEEAAIDGIPAIVVDPKGDLGNLLLTFPALQPADFEPWLDSADAVRKGVSIGDYAAQTAQRWKDGLAAWGEDGARIERFRNSVDIAIYTPGSQAGLPLTVLRSFAAPGESVRDDAETLRERISAAASGLLALLGIDADPIRSREHILVSCILDRAWRAGEDLDLNALIRQVQQPPFDSVGALNLESFYPAKERFELSMQLNNLLASPGFSAWKEGEPLDIQRLLYTPAGKPRLSILSIAHLTDAERMFFVTILLNELIAWMRAQSGTSSLRALFYMDEIFGYFPPSANPPSKLPMLTLLKQARAFGLGCVLATQNPVDLDYKGLSNTGTWFLGRLQTERDKARVLDGLEGAASSAGAAFDRAAMDKLLSGLTTRVFLMNNVHDDAPVLFESRWALSFLRGPLTRDQIQTLMAPRKASVDGAVSSTQTEMAVKSPLAGGQRPMLPPGMVELFLKPGKTTAGGTILYKPALLGSATIAFRQASAKVDTSSKLSLFSLLDGEIGDAVWEAADVWTDSTHELTTEPEPGASFAEVPGELGKPKLIASLTTALKEYLYRTNRLSIWKSLDLKELSEPGESEGDFRARIAHAAREVRDEQVDQLHKKYAPKIAALEEKLRKAHEKIEKEKSQASQQMYQTALSFGSSILGALFGRKLRSATNVTRAASTARQAGRLAKERADVGYAEDSEEVLKQKQTELESELQDEVRKVQDSVNADSLKLEEVSIAPRKTDITVNRVALVWVPWLVGPDGMADPMFTGP